MVVTAGAGNREAEKTLRQRVDLVVPLVGAGLGKDDVIAREPGSKTEEAEPR